MLDVIIAGKWIAEKLAGVAWDRLREEAKQPRVVECFEEACRKTATLYPDLISDKYTAPSIANSPTGESLDNRLLGMFDNLRFPDIDNLTEMLIDAWSNRKRALEPEEAAKLFCISVEEARPVLRRLAISFFRELAKEPEYRDPIIVSGALRILDEEENGDIPEAIRTAVSLLSSTKQVEREDGIRALAKMNHPEAINALAQALRSPYPDVQRAAAIRLGVLRDPRAMPVLEKTIKENASWRQVYPSMMELLKAFGSDAVPSLGRVLLEDPIGLDRRDAATALGIIGDTKAVPQLVRSLHDDDSGVRGCAADALGEIRTSDLDAVRGLKELLSDSAEISHNRQRAILLPYVSDTACLALISIGTPEALQAVQAYREAHAQRFAVLPRQRKQKKTENEE